MSDPTTEPSVEVEEGAVDGVVEGAVDGAVDAPAHVSPGRVYAAVFLALGVAAALSTGRMVAVAERMPFGATRTALLSVLRPIDAAAHAAGLGAPAHAVVGARASLGLDPGGSGGPVDRAPADDGARARGGAATDAARAPDDPRAATAAALVRTAGQGAPGGTAAAGGGVVAFGPSPTAPATPTATPPPARPIAPDAPLRVVVAGDSFAQPLGFELQNYATRDGMTAVEVDGRISTGLARPDYFDWPGRMAEIVATTDPEAVVFFVGANDDQNMVLDDETVVELGTTVWTDAYAARAGALMDACRGRRLYWVGMPVMREERRHRAAEQVNTAVRRAAATRGWVKFVDIWETFKGPDGRFSLYLPDETGEQVEMRGADGTHLSRTGTNKVAAMLYNAFGRAWDLSTPTPTATSTATPEPTEAPTPEPTEALPAGRPPAAPSPPVTPRVPRIVTATPAPRQDRPPVPLPRIVTATPRG